MSAGDPPDLELGVDPRGTILPVRAQPGARRPGIVGTHGGAVRVAVSAAPEKGKANAAVAEALADALGCRAGDVVLVSGPTARAKRFLIVGLDPTAVRDRLETRLTAAARRGPTP